MSKFRALLLPGLDGTGHLFDSFIEASQKFLDCEIVSYPIKGAQSYEILGELATHQFNATGSKIIIAESFSGPVAVHIARTNPEKLKAIVLVSSFVKPPMLFNKLLIQSAPLLPYFPCRQAAISTLLTNGNRIYTHRITNTLKTIPPAIISSRIKSALSIDCQSEYASIATPILALAGKQDRLFRPHSFKDFIQNPRASLEFIDGPHCLLQCEPELTAEKIRSFLVSI